MPFRHPTPLRRLVVLAGLALAIAAGAAHAGPKEAFEQLSPEYREWLDEVAPIISKEELDAFLALEKDYQRDAFIQRFWEVRDPYPDTVRNEARESWESRLAEAKQSFPNLTEDRARIFLLNGPPAVRLVGRCASMWPLEIWAYARSTRTADNTVLVFYQRGHLSQWRLWLPDDGLSALFQFSPPGASANELLQEVSRSCMRSDDIASGIVAVLRQSPSSYMTTIAQVLRPIEPPSREWVSTFNSYSTDLPDDATQLAAELSVDYPGRRQARSILQATIEVPVEAVKRDEASQDGSYNFVLNGEVLRGRRLFDAFRYKFDLPTPSVTGESIPLVFERFLRPGDYTLIVKVEDLNGGGVYREQREVEVPKVEQDEFPTIDDETAKILAEANAALSTLDNTIEILEPSGEFQSGLVRFDTMVTGPDTAKVEFDLDGRPILVKTRPPYSVELDLGEVPTTRTLRATAYDAAGEEIASDESLLNASPHRFSIRLVEPRRGKTYRQSLRAEAQVEVPEDASLERVEFYLNETLVATLYQEPFTQPIVLPPSDFVAYVRAVAYQTDGNSTEDLVFVNAPENLDDNEIQFAELYTTVLDRENHPVWDLSREDFSVSEDGVPQTLTRFERLQNLPIHVAVLLDISASMEPKLVQARAAAQKFFQEAVTPRDRAALIPFNDRPSLAVKMTKDLDQLAIGLAGLKAERGTSLYDAVVYSLFYFNGIKGQRAMLLLSDGKDENSQFTLEQTRDFVRRAGVAIYTIGLDIGRTEFETRRILKSLSDETGGRSFFVGDAAELGPIYDAIQEELRSRYLLAYQSTNSERSLKFRVVDVQVDRSGLEAKTIRGYYP